MTLTVEERDRKLELEHHSRWSYQAPPIASPLVTNTPSAHYPALLTSSTMSSARLVLRSSRLAARSLRPFSTTTARFADEPAPYDYAAINARTNDTSEQYRKFQMERPLNPHMTNTNSTIANEMPGIGKDNAPPELITHADPAFVPKDSVPENTNRMTGGTQNAAPEGGVNAELNVGEIEGGTFRVEPLRRTGEDANTMRARLVCQ